MEIAIIVLLSVLIALQIVILLRKQKPDGGVLEEIRRESDQTRRSLESVQRTSSQVMFDGLRATNEQVLESVKEISKNNETRLSEMRETISKSLSDMRQDIRYSLGEVRQDNAKQMEAMRLVVDEMRNTISKNLGEIRQDLKGSLSEVREDNTKQLEAMRLVVDEKLSSTLNERLSQSFNIISERLEAVSKGLGEMQTLASGVTDLKKVLTNVKTRGTWGEVSLEAILSEILTPEQYERSCNVSGRGSRDRVDFAIILPGKDNDKVYLPIDVKFPTEDYQRLGEAAAEGNLDEYNACRSQLISRVKQFARSISGKYINPPITTDFAVMYLPIEGLYAEILRQNGLVEELQNSFKIVPAGPANIAAMLNTLRMGFRTLTIQKYSAEIFKVLSSFRSEFSKFADLVDKAQSQIDNASRSLSDATRRTEKINKQLAKIETIAVPEGEDVSAPPLID